MNTVEYRKSQLNLAIKRFIKEKESELERTCRKIWQFTNHLGQTFLFGSFCKNHNRLVVTIGYFNKDVNGHFIPARN